MLQRTRSIVWTLWYLVFLLFGIAFTVAQYQLMQYRGWQGYFIGALGGALFALLLIIGRVLIRTRHGLVQRKYLDRFSPAAQTFHLMNLLTGYGALVVEVQRWDVPPDWRRKLMPQYQRFRQTLTSVEKWRAERSGAPARSRRARRCGDDGVTLHAR